MTTTTEHSQAETHSHTHGPTCNHATCECAHCSDSCANCACADCTCSTCQHAA